MNLPLHPDTWMASAQQAQVRPEPGRGGQINPLERQVLAELVHQSHAVHVVIGTVFPDDVLAVPRKRSGAIAVGVCAPARSGP